MSTDWSDVKIASAYDDSPDAATATEAELEHIIQTQNIPQASPLSFERANPASPYMEQIGVSLDDNDQIFLEAVKITIANGWVGYKHIINDAVTLGTEAEKTVKTIKQKRLPVKEVLFDHDFNRCLWGANWENRLAEMAIAPSIIKYLKEALDGINMAKEATAKTKNS